MPVFRGAASFGFEATNSGNEKTPWLSLRAKTSAGLFVRIQSAVRFRDGHRKPFACEARASAAPARAWAATTSRAPSRAFCMAPASVRGGAAPAAVSDRAREGARRAAARKTARAATGGLSFIEFSYITI